MTRLKSIATMLKIMSIVSIKISKTPMQALDLKKFGKNMILQLEENFNNTKPGTHILEKTNLSQKPLVELRKSITNEAPMLTNR